MLKNTWSTLAKILIENLEIQANSKVRFLLRNAEMSRIDNFQACIVQIEIGILKLKSDIWLLCVIEEIWNTVAPIFLLLWPSMYTEMWDMIALRKPSCTPRMLVTEEGHRNDDACEDDKSIFHSLALVSYRVFLNVQICPKCTLASLVL